MNLALLNEVTEEFACYLSEVTDGDLNWPTPCARWTVRDLYGHLTEANAAIAAELDPGAAQPKWRGGCASRESRYRDSAGRAADAIARATKAGTRPPAPAGARSPGDLFESHLANTLIHTWDLAGRVPGWHPAPR